MHQITVTLSLEELMDLPGEAVIRLLDKARPSGIFLQAASEHENRPLHGRGRWPVNNHLRNLLANPPRVGCAACDRGDFQLGHADGCPQSAH
jgi:hypothetical protein